MPCVKTPTHATSRPPIFQVQHVMCDVVLMLLSRYYGHRKRSVSLPYVIDCRCRWNSRCWVTENEYTREKKPAIRHVSRVQGDESYCRRGHVALLEFNRKDF